MYITTNLKQVYSISKYLSSCIYNTFIQIYPLHLIHKLKSICTSLLSLSISLALRKLHFQVLQTKTTNFPHTLDALKTTIQQTKREMSSLGKTSAALLLIRRSTYSATSTLLPNGGAGGSSGAEAAGAAALPHAGVGVAKEIEKSIASGALQRRQQQQKQQQQQQLQRELKREETTLPIR